MVEKGAEVEENKGLRVKWKESSVPDRPVPLETRPTPAHFDLAPCETATDQGNVKISHFPPSEALEPVGHAYKQTERSVWCV